MSHTKDASYQREYEGRVYMYLPYSDNMLTVMLGKLLRQAFAGVTYDARLDAATDSLLARGYGPGEWDHTAPPRG